jgi:hypothetical protein
MTLKLFRRSPTRGTDETIIIIIIIIIKDFQLLKLKATRGIVCSRKHIYTGADPEFVVPEAYTIVGALFKKKKTKLPIKITNTKLGTKVFT